MPKGHCLSTPGCPNPAKRYLCPRHMAIQNKNQNKARALRRLLGFCIFCTTKAVSGHTRCAKHLKENEVLNQAMRDRKTAKRGWKLARVKTR